MQDIVSKWGREVAERGFAQVPNYLMQINLHVHDDHKLSPAEMVVLLQLVASWWKVNEMPFPSMSTLAQRAGISERQVQRAIKALEQKGYLTKAKKKIKGVIASNVYDLSPLVKILQTVAEHFINKHPRNIHDPKDTKTEKRVYVERRSDGDYAVKKPQSQRAQAIAPTQAEAIALARKLDPDAVPHVERVRHVPTGKPDKWRKA
jgi:DNA replication protein DnaD